MSIIELHYYLATSLEQFHCSRCFPSDVEYTYIRRVIGVELQHWVIPLVVQKSGFTTAQVGGSLFHRVSMFFIHPSRFGAPSPVVCCQGFWWHEPRWTVGAVAGKLGTTKIQQKWLMLEGSPTVLQTYLFTIWPQSQCLFIVYAK